LLEREAVVVGDFFLQAAASLLAVAAQTVAETPAPDRTAPTQDIVVTGDPLDEAERVSTFLERYARTTRIGQLARWHEPVCVRTWGLPLEQNALISNHVMDVAERIGARTDRSESCVPNVRIGFTDDPQQAIDQVARRAPLVLGFHYASQHDRLTRIRFPVQAWYATITGGTDGDGLLDAVGYETVNGRAGSRLGRDIASSFAHVLILADSRIAIGREAAEIGDLLAFLALAQSAPTDDCDPGGTILNLLNPACEPGQRNAAFTDRDLAYLEALYYVTPTLGPSQQRGAIAIRMRRDLTDDQGLSERESE